MGDRLALGNTLATATMICALAWCALICAALTIPKLYSPRTYVIFLALSSFGIMLVFGLPVHLVDFRFRRQSMDDDLKAHMLYKHFNCSVDEMVQNQGRDAVIETALRAASHICTSLFGYLATSFFSQSMHRLGKKNMFITPSLPAYLSIGNMSSLFSS